MLDKCFGFRCRFSKLNLNIIVNIDVKIREHYLSTDGATPPSVIDPARENYFYSFEMQQALCCSVKCKWLFQILILHYHGEDIQDFLRRWWRGRGGGHGHPGGAPQPALQNQSGGQTLHQVQTKTIIRGENWAGKRQGLYKLTEHIAKEYWIVFVTQPRSG